MPNGELHASVAPTANCSAAWAPSAAWEDGGAVCGEGKTKREREKKKKRRSLDERRIYKCTAYSMPRLQSLKAPRTHPIGIENSSISPRCVGHRHRLIHRLRETNTLTLTHSRHAHAHLPVAVAGVSLALLHVALQLVKHVSKYTYYYLGSTATSCPCYTPWSSGCLLACLLACMHQQASHGG
ncbi:hypothetical protein LI328DRAFT_158329 [Trichoderma asperelloides]|nr:hypothetical protein LI328DRAFT_158329 [Trichoderma asperelloides]